MHRFVLAEFNTHRVFSRNSASSRAIPLRKQLDRVLNDPAFPVSWPAEQPGMSGGDELEPEGLVQLWMIARNRAVECARAAGNDGLHKSVANRLLEPFMWHTVVVTSTSWQNFFGLRCNPMAQPEIREAAEAMYQAYEESAPRPTKPGEWHLPYIQPDEIEFHEVHDLIRVSSARCARVSYLTQNGVRDISEDLKLYSRLVSATPMHASPLEHVATPNHENRQEIRVQRRVMLDGVRKGTKTLTLPKYGNLLGWHQHRFDIEILRDYQAHS